MKVFVAGATGAVGKRLVPQLLAGGHHVVAMSRSIKDAASVGIPGVHAVAVDALNRAAVIKAVTEARPEVVVHQMTALTGVSDYKNFDTGFAVTNRLRTEGTDYLLEAAREAGVRCFIAQSYGNWNYSRTGTSPKTENDPLDDDPPKNQVKTLKAIKYLEKSVLGANGIQGVALRYGNLYGPGTGFALDGAIAAMVRKRGLPVVGDGEGIWSFIHVDDAASAVIAAIQMSARGIYNIVDDEPAPVAVWLPELAKAVGAKPPRRVPVWLARVAIGEVGVSMMTRIRGASNAKANVELKWSPSYSSWRQGFRTGLS